MPISSRFDGRPALAIASLRPADAHAGTPFFLAAAARRQGLPARSLQLKTSGAAWRRQRILWNAGQALAHGRYGGFQYTATALAAAWRADPPRAGETVLSLFQLLPERLHRSHDGPICFYIDQTLTQMFGTYGPEAALPEAIKRRAVAQEARHYASAHHIYAQSAYAARSVVADYGIPATKVSVLLPGANLDPEAVADWEAAGPRRRPPGPLRLVFVGKDWRRKGLDRLIRAVRIARGQGASIDLRVIGLAPETVPPALSAVPGIEWIGPVDKSRESRRFLDLVAWADIGCLLSRAEAGGIALREFRRLGLICLVPRVGGAPEYVTPAARHLIAPSDTPGDIAACLVRLAQEPALLHRQAQAAWDSRGAADWSYTAKALAHSPAALAA